MNNLKEDLEELSELTNDEIDPLGLSDMTEEAMGNESDNQNGDSNFEPEG